LLTDIESSTPLLRRLGAAYDEVLATHHRLIREAVGRCGGVEVKTEGDAFIVVFVDPTDAIAAATVAQRALVAEAWPEGVALRVRMGLHRGEARVVNDDYISLALHQAARVLAAANGSQILMSSRVADAVESLPPDTVLDDLGGFHVRDFDAVEHLHQVVHPDLPSDLPPPRVPSALVHNLVLARSPFVGMTNELAELTKLVEGARLTTIVGAGGIGKTRLSCEVGLAVAWRYPQGVWFVGLADMTDDVPLVSAVADALGVVDQRRSLVDVIVERLSVGPAVLILDNCEHLLAATADLLEHLLDSCPELTVLATSREPLGVPGEEVFRLTPLPVPREDQTLAELQLCESVSLFCQRGALARRGFALDETNRVAVAEICRRLDGIPLALELAAARLGAMSVADMAARLTDRFTLASAGPRRAPERQRTMRATLDWSHSLLDEDEQSLFRRLAVFGGGATLDAIEAVCVDQRLDADAIADLLGSLVDKSLVVLDEHGTTMRYRLLEPTRAYATDKLDATDETERLSAAHLRWCLVLAEEAEALLSGPDQASALAGLDDELANIRRALGWASAHDPAGALALGGALYDFWHTRGHHAEARGWIEPLLADAREHPSVPAARALRVVARAAQSRGDFDAARTGYEDSLAMSRGLADKSGMARTLAALATVALVTGDYDAAQAGFEESLAVSREVGHKGGVGAALLSLADVAFDQGDYDVARLGYEEALVIGSELDDKRRVALSRVGLAGVCFYQGDFEAARAGFETSLAISRELGDKLGVAFALGSVANVAIAQGDYDAARTVAEESLAISRELAYRRGVALALGHLANIAAAEGDYDAARLGFEESLAISRELGDKRRAAFSLVGRAKVATAQEDSDSARAAFREALDLASGHGNYQALIEIIEGTADIDLRAGELDAGTRLYGAADGLRSARGTPRAPRDKSRVDAQIGRGRAALGDDAFTRLWGEGAEMALDEAVTATLDSLNRDCA
jgi:predicted ATPase/class 3 adenylate cyclase/Tfp pilus assembly protein PilF